jgi:membrane protein
VAGSAQYEAIYSSFAILIVFMIWLYVNWLILLLGVDISFYAQHSRYLRLKQRDIRLGYGLFRRIGLSVMYQLAERFHRGEPPWTVADLAVRLDLPHQVIERILETLQRQGLVIAVDRERMAYLPAREPCVTPMADVLNALESGSGDADAYPFSHAALAEPAVEQLASRLQEAGDKAAEGMTLKDFIESAAP